MKKWILVPLLLGVIIFGLAIGLKQEQNSISIGNIYDKLEYQDYKIGNSADSVMRSLDDLSNTLQVQLDKSNALIDTLFEVQHVLSDKLWALELNDEPNEHDIVGNILNANVYIAAYNANNFLMWQGSGTIITEDGLVLTAGHVIGDDWEKPAYFEIELFDGKKFTSDNFVRRNDVDLGFIQIDANNLSFIDSFETEVDYIDEVYICGNPYGYECRHNITKGIISGLNRDFEGFFGDYYLIQADAQSQPGNSGGGVFNMQGEIIGVLVGGYQGVDGMSLIIPSDLVVKVLECYNDELVLEGMKIKNGD